ncbi:hypothetical protein [Glaciecola petra]|uniref:Uncharacterized protein n=1 Tax=Glaciecola petra TaxID=3075602 RepID=A0ABU2ZSU8_9ALTE|nr:hypothetical protein [Aestuariibacter sp. P117]MDT0595490.1 hypothetical protein [Aestuariibacter sp. P117]
MKFRKISTGFHGFNIGFCLTLLLATTLSFTAFAGQKDDEVEKCVSVDNDIARLLCYDTLFGRGPAKEPKLVNQKTDKPESLASQKPLAPITDKAAPPPKEPLKTTSVEESFGEEQLKKDKVDEGPTEIKATVSTITENSRGLRTFTLVNGQKWREKESSRLKIKVGQEVTLKKGSFSAYFMKKEGSNRTIRVRRIN